MAIDILNIQPNVISRDLKGKYIAIYGAEKVGKTTFAAQNPKTLICAFEIGTNFLAGVKVQPIQKWAQMKLVLRQLEKPEAKEMYDCIAIDTVAEAYSLCEEYICAQNQVQRIGEIPYGAGYAMTKREFEKTLRQITMLGYGIICLCHSQVKNESVGEDTVVEKISPAMPARAADVVNRLVDVIGYIQVDWENVDGVPVSKRTLLTRSTPTIMAGSRLKYLAPKIPFGYQELVDAISDAIDKEEKLCGASVTDLKQTNDNEKLDFTEIRKEAEEIWTRLVNKNESYAEKILKKVEDIFGRPMKLSQITEDQVDLMYLVLLEMRDLEKNLI